MNRSHFIALAVFVAVSSVFLIAYGGATNPPSDETETPHEVKDRATFTVSTGQILLEDGGRICAEKVKSDVNKVTIRGARLVDVQLYHQGEINKQIRMPRADLDGSLVVYTNGANTQVNILATANTCIAIDQPSQTTLEAYYMTSDVLDTTGLSIQTGENVVKDVPQPGGLSFGDLAVDTTNVTTENQTQVGDRDGIADPVTTETPTRTAEEIAEQTDPSTRVANRTTSAKNGTVDGVNTTSENVADVSDSTTETVDETTDAADNSVGETTEETDGTTNSVEDIADNTTSGTIDNTTDTVDETTNETTDSVDDTSTETTDTVDETINGTTDTVDETTDDTMDTLDNSTNTTTDSLDDSTDDVTTTVDETTSTLSDETDNLTTTPTNTTSTDSTDGSLLGL